MNEIRSGCAVRAESQEDAILEREMAIAEQVVLNVCEIPDRNSPDEQPEMLLVTCEELHNAVLLAFERYRDQQ
jgi:hypothetical protein